MFDFLRGSRPSDIKGIRNALVMFIKEQLQKAEGGEGKNIKGLSLYITCGEEERHLYEGALYADDEDKFKEEEVQKIADDFAISLPEDWTFDFEFVEQAPDEAIKATQIDAALYISTKKKPRIYTDTTAYIKVLVGETEKEVYELAPTMGKITIGREKQVQTVNGFYRENIIAFTGTANESNRSVSRQHAHIEWDTERGAYYLYADEGGIPPYNKMKVKAEDGIPVKLQTIEIGHRLQEGDQIILGDSAVLEFCTSLN